MSSMHFFQKYNG